jgi:hypothetical protein
VKRENQKAVGGITSVAAAGKGLIFQLDWEIGSAGFLYLFDELYLCQKKRKADLFSSREKMSFGCVYFRVNERLWKLILSEKR